MRETFRVVVGLSGSAQARHALDWAVAQAVNRDREGQPTTVQVVTAWQQDVSAEPLAAYTNVADPKAAADARLCAAIARARDVSPQLNVAGIAVEGRAVEVLVQYAAAADLLVIGSGHHARLYQALFGSITEGCIRGATCPVVVIPATLALAAAVTDHPWATQPG
jgi:nucleotide-binding universal stress UspA family protein